jgi:hypothetical protein
MLIAEGSSYPTPTGVCAAAGCCFLVLKVRRRPDVLSGNNRKLIIEH